MGLSAISLFSGGGGLDLGLERAGIARTVCRVEHEAYACAVLAARSQDGSLDDAPIWSDVSTFDGKPWRGVVDLVAGGFPCQDISNAGKRAGIVHGQRSGLWGHFARIIDEVAPRFVFVENVAALVRGGLDTVLDDLASLGFDAEWGCFKAADVGAPHLRDRVFVLAFTSGIDWRGWAARAGRGAGVAGDGGHPQLADPVFSRLRAGGKPERGLDAEPGDDVVGHAFGCERGRVEKDAGRGSLRRVASGGTGGSGIEGLALPKCHRLEGLKPAGTEALPVERGGGTAAEPEGFLGDSRCRCCEGVGCGCVLDGERATRGRDHHRPSVPWPPGPDDAAGWADYLAHFPSLEPAIRVRPHGVAPGMDAAHANRTHQLRLLGNGVVPQQAALAWDVLMRRLMG